MLFNFKGLNVLQVSGLLLFCFPAVAASSYPQLAADARETLRELVEINTTNPPGNEAKAVEIIQKRLQEAKIPFNVTEFAPGRKNIVARLKGSESNSDPLMGPVLLLAHIDVVGADG